MRLPGLPWLRPLPPSVPDEKLPRWQVIYGCKLWSGRHPPFIREEFDDVRIRRTIGTARPDTAEHQPCSRQLRSGGPGGRAGVVSGQGPIRDGKVIYTGKVGAEVSEEDGYAAARLTGLNLLAVLQAELGTLDRVKRVAKVLGWVNSAPGFHRQPAIVNGVSDLLVQVFGESGRHARSAVSMDFVFDMAFEAEMVVEVLA